jgi:endonuclease/exonuclease/phosphatase (EEP) superfamily protein YafD
VAGVSWWADIVANASAQIGAVGALAGITALLRRRWIPGIIMLAGVAMAWWPLLAWRAPRSDESDVRILVWNTLVSNTSASVGASLILDSGADVCVILEPSGALLDEMRESARIAQEFPYAALPDNAGPGFRVILSRWPMRHPDTELDGPPIRVKARIVDRPEGPFLFVAAHPRSARSAALWREGHAEVDRIADLARRAAGRFPVVVAGDFNSTPTGSRSRHLCREGGLLRATPMLAGGTWPAWWPGWLSASIDDVAVGPGVEVSSWRRLRGSGSDHRPVVVDVSLDGAP